MKNKKPRKNILVVTGTRAEYGLLRSTIFAIQKSKILSLHLLVTGMHTQKKYGLTWKDIERDGVPIAARVPVGEHDDMLTSFTKEVAGIKKYCEKNRPDLVLVLGDRDEPFAAAIVAGHLGIPCAHIHGGDVTGPIVDEYIRHSLTKFSHLHFTATKKSFTRVCQLGEEKSRVFNVGAPGLDELNSGSYLSRTKIAKALGLNPHMPWLLLLQHPVALDTVSVQNQITATIDGITSILAEKICIYPNSDTGSDKIIKALSSFAKKSDVHLYKNLERKVYVSLLKESQVLLGNSSSGIIESGFFKLPTVNIGPRQTGRECGSNVIHVPYTKKSIQTAVQKALSPEFKKSLVKQKNPYGTGDSGKKIVTILEKNISRSNLLNKKFTYA